MERYLQQRGSWAESWKQELLAEFDKEIDDAIEFAEKSPYPDSEEALDHVFSFSVRDRELARSLANDPAIAPGKIRMAERQLNARLSAYGDALGNREGEGSGWHLGRTLLEFAGHRDEVRPSVVATAGDLLARYLGEANAALRKSFGAATLPG